MNADKSAATKARGGRIIWLKLVVSVLALAVGVMVATSGLEPFGPALGAANIFPLHANFFVGLLFATVPAFMYFKFQATRTEGLTKAASHVIVASVLFSIGVAVLTARTFGDGSFALTFEDLTRAAVYTLISSVTCAVGWGSVIYSAIEGNKIYRFLDKPPGDGIATESDIRRQLRLTREETALKRRNP